MAEEKAGSGAGPSVGMWTAGAAAGVAIGALFWYFATMRAPEPVPQAPLAAAPGSAPDAGTEAAAAVPTEAPGAGAETGDAAEPMSDAPAAGKTSAEAPSETDIAPAADAVPETSAATADAVAAPDGTAPAATRQAALAPEATAPAASEATSPEAAGGAVAAPPEPPRFDTVRAEADGSVLVAGRAQAGTEVAVLVDGVEAAGATADPGGSFAAFLSLGPSEAPRVLTLVMRAADGTRTASTQSVIIAPVAAPEAVAGATAGAGAAAADVAETAPAAGAAEVAEPVPEPERLASAESAAAPAPTAPEDGAGAGTSEPDASQPSAPEVLIVDDTGVRRQTDAPVQGIVIDTIGYSAEGEVQVAGRGEGGAFARLYLDNRELLTVPIGEDGIWATVLNGIAPGLYTLRVDQVDRGGKVGARFETPFQREAPEAVAAARTGPAPDVAAAEPAAPPAPSADATAAATADSSVARPDADAALAPQPAEAPEKPALVASVVTVQPGFTLWRIARENYGRGILYVKVFEANKSQIRDPDLIYPGQIFTVPVE